nr:MAG TPA: hypothetical protein [Caudoviricetes sp.]
MALFNGNKRVEGSRSNTHLVKSGHMSPAEKWILDPKFKDNDMSSVFKDGVLFEYEYGGDGFTDVVIPKGRVVGVAKPVKDFVSKKFVTTMTLPGMATDNNCVGMVPYNICKDYFQQDRFGGNAPSIITLDYVTLPYIPSVAAATTMNKTGILQEEKALSVDLKMPWGAVIGAGITEGCYVKATPSGRLCKWDKGKDNFCDVVGQVLATDLNNEMWGWYKWMLWDEQVRNDDDQYINRSGVSNLPSDTGYPYDPSYADGSTVFQNYQSQFVNAPTGIPGLHDGMGDFEGYGKNDTEYKDIELGEVPVGVKDETIMAFQALDLVGGKLNNLRPGVVVKIDGTQVDADRITINYKKGIINVKLTTGDASKPVTATYKAMHYGTPSYLDYKGVVGAVHVLLKK